MKSYSITTKGSFRKNNEDNLYSRDKRLSSLDNIYIVCDGVGGNNYGEVASKLTIKYFVKGLKINKECNNIKTILQNALTFASNKIFEKETNKKYFGMCTTFICTTIKDNKLYALSVGDSRIYFISDNSIKQLTKDDIEVSEENVLPQNVVADIKKNNPNVNEKLLNQKIIKKKLTKAVGFTKNLIANYYEIDLSNKSNELKVILCSDGLYDGLNENDILHIVCDSNLKENKKCKKLICEAIKKGSKDNISVILIDIN